MESLAKFRPVKDKKVLARCDFNVPLNDSGEILDDFKIRSTVPTIDYLLKRGARVILMSHLAENRSLEPVAEKLKGILGREVKFLADYLGRAVKDDLVLLENLRLNKGEEVNDGAFAKRLASLGDIYVNDAFAVSHRAHASLVGVPKYLPSFAGLLLEKEIDGLKKITNNPKKPLIAVIGGAKVETKTKVIEKISQNADFVLIGGLIACEIKEKNIEFKNRPKIIFPETNAVCDLDINERTINLFKEKIKIAKTVFWAGPLGKVEDREFRKGTLSIAKAIIESGAYSVAGGGETVWFLAQSGLLDKFSHVSTGGGAMLAFLAGEKLPGLEALDYYGN